METSFQLFSTCIAVKGAMRGCIYDLEKNKIHIVPSSMIEILQCFEGKTKQDVKDFFHNAQNDTIDEYFAFLIEEDLILFSNNLENFVSINTNWDAPNRVTNCIIDLSHTVIKHLESIVKSLNHLDCTHVELRSFVCYSLQDISCILDSFRYSTVTSIEVIVPYINNTSVERINQFCDSSSRIVALILHSSPFEKRILSNEYLIQIYYKNTHLSDEKHCGLIHEDLLNPNLPHYTESLHHNTCLNRKIAIDAEGNIKNCPSMKESFGNIRDTTLEEAINKPGFKKYWNIKKDDITKCKDCEFRHVCTDCRVYIDNPEDIYSAPLKCGYDPYTCTWEEWSTNPLKQKAIDYYGMRDIL